MASIIGKTIRGQTYYYLREVARVGGKPKIVSQRYLGKASDIEAAVAGATVVPDRTRHLAFGDVAAVWAMLGRLKVAEIIDEVVGPRHARRRGIGGDLHRPGRPEPGAATLAPSSLFPTGGPRPPADRWLRLPASALDHRRFWEAMGAMSEEQLKEVERRIVAGMVGSFGVDLSGLVLDMTNFATWIASANDRAPIAQRGHSKQKRTDLRLVGLGLVVSTDGGVPWSATPTPATAPTSPSSRTWSASWARRFEALVGKEDGAGRLTLVFDAGQNSKDNYELLEGLPFHFVGSLPPSDHPDLLAVGKSRYAAGRRGALPGPDGFEATKVVFGDERRVVVTHSEDLHDNSPPASTRRWPRPAASWTSLQARLARGKTKRPRTKSRRRWPKS